MSEGSIPASKPMLRSTGEEAALAAVTARFDAAGITRLADVTRLDVVGIPTWQAIRPKATTLAVSQGKGRTHTAARLSAAMECIEHASWERFEPEPIWSCVGELSARGRVVELGGISDSILQRVDSRAVLPWCHARDLTTHEDVWVPYDAVCVRRGGTHRKGPRISYASTNGLAAGSTLAEATLHAILEVIERDAHTCAEFLMERDSVPRPQVDLDTLSEPDVHQLVDRVRAAGLEVRAFWNLSELGIPCCSAYIIDDYILGLTNSGHGAHLDPHQALERAITEAAQGRITMISGAREDNLRADYRYLWEVGSTLSLRARHESALAGKVAAVSWSLVLKASTPDMALASMLAHMKDRGFASPLRIDMTDSDIGVPVAKVLIAGTCGYHRALRNRIEQYATWVSRRGSSVEP